MRKLSSLMLLLLFILSASQAQVWENGKGIMLYTSGVKFLGDAADRAAVGSISGIGLKYAPGSLVMLDLQAGYGSFKPSLPGSHFEKNADSPYRTFLFPFTLGARVAANKTNPIKPYLTLGAGILFWDLRYLSGEKQTFWQDHQWRWGERVSGWRKNGLLYQGLGLELYFTPALSLDVQTRFSSLIHLRRDNTGEDDINSQVLQIMAGLTWYWGYQRDRDHDGILDKYDLDPLKPEDFDGFQDQDGAPELDNDQDGVADACDLLPMEAEDKDNFEDHDGAPDLDNDQDGIADDKDLCPAAPEDLDSYEDHDGCPDLDNDRDGIPDADDECPNQKEDMDGFEDKDGCPDPDNDGDGIPDTIDKCPNQAETINGYLDGDGCPEVTDTDGDGIPDDRDRCPDEAENKNGSQDDDGCPDEMQVKQTELSNSAIILTGVNFASGKATLTEESLPVLDETANSLILDRSAIVEIRGYTDNVGKAEDNQLLSERRAEAVRRYLISKGITADRITAIGFGERYPIADNSTAEGRAKNRRIEFKRVK